MPVERTKRKSAQRGANSRLISDEMRSAAWQSALKHAPGTVRSWREYDAVLSHKWPSSKWPDQISGVISNSFRSRNEWAKMRFNGPFPTMIVENIDVEHAAARLNAN